MQRKILSVAVSLLLIFTLGENPATSLAMQSRAGDQQATHERTFQAMRDNFGSGRDLLLNEHVPFDPDELLRDGWMEKLKPTLDAMPEMHQNRYETAPMKGAYMADTLYLPEKVQLSGHTVILANYVVFEGKKPVVKGNFDLHFFPTKPVVVLGTTLAAALHQKAQFLNVKLGRKTALPSFSLIQDLGQTGKHAITFDVSGLPPEAARHQRKAVGQVRNVSWNALDFAEIPLPADDCPPTTAVQSCSTTPDAGQTGKPGFSPPPAPKGNPDGGPAAASGSCGVGQSPNGFAGSQGGAGAPATNAGDGGPGGLGGNARNINANIRDGDTNEYTFKADGGQGGDGGPGGTGGTGGDGGAGIPGGSGVACGCTVGVGGNGGRGGDAGIGGHGGNGGIGGNGGNGGVIVVSLPWNSPGAITSVSSGAPGRGGDAGANGSPGNPGVGGPPGSGATACGQTASNGSFIGGGNSAGSRDPGNPGPNGQSAGQPGSANVSVRTNPNGGGGGGGGEDPCLGGQGPDPGTGPGFNGGGGGIPDPTCSPIIIDTESEGFHLTSAATGVMFDIAGNGHPVQIAWTATGFGNAFLALPAPDGLVHNGKELFGNFTPQPASNNPNGFLALAEFDKPEHGGNGDGVIDEHDTVYSRLRLWIDANHDGISQPEELHTLAELGVYALSLRYHNSRRTDEFGNQFRFRAQVNQGIRRDRRDEASEIGRWTYDVFLTTTTK